LIFSAIKGLKDNFTRREPISLGMDEAAARSVINNYNDMKLSADAFIERTNLSDAAMKSYLRTVQSGNATFAGCTQHINSMGNSISLMGVKAKATSLLLSGLKIAAGMIAMSLISSAVSGLFGAIDNIVHRSEKIAEAAQEAKEKIEQLNNAFKSNKSTVDSLKDNYAQLAQGVDLVTNKNISLSDDDYKEFLDTSNQLAEIFPSLTRNYDENGNAILNLNGDANTIVKTLDDLVERERQLANIQIADNLPKLYEGFRQNINKYELELDELEKHNKNIQEILHTAYDVYDMSDKEIGVQWKFDDVALDELGSIDLEIREALASMGVDLSDVVVNFGENVNAEGITEGTFLNLFINKEDFKYIDGVEEILGNRLLELGNSIGIARTNLEAEISSFNTSLYAWMSSDPIYQSQEKDQQDILKQLLFNDDWLHEAYKDPNIDGTEWDQVATFLQDRYINAINKIDDNEIKKKLSDLFDTEIDPNTKIQIAQELQTYFAENDIQIPLSFILDGEKDGSAQNLVDRLQNSISLITGEDTRSQEELTKYTSEFNEDQINIWLKVTQGIKNAGEAIRAYEEYINNLSKQEIKFFTESNLTEIDNYKSKISDLASYLESINTNGEVSADEISALNTEYGIVANSTEEYKQKIVECMNEAALSSNIMETLAEAIELCNDASEKERLQNLYETLRKLNIEAQNNADSFGNFATAINTLQGKAELLRDINEGIKDVGYIDSSKFDDIISKYPRLTAKVAEYNQGLITSTELFNELQTAYEKDAKNYKIAMAYKLQDNKDFYNDFVEKIPQWLKDQATSYDINFKDYKTLQEAKLALDKEYLHKKAILETKAKLTESALSLINSDDPYGLMASGAFLGAATLFSNAEKELEKFETFLDSFDTTLSTTINFDTSWKSYGKDPGDDDTEDKKEPKEIDWLAQSVSNATREVDRLNDKLDDTTSLSKRMKVYEELEEANQNLVDTTRHAADEYGKIWESKSKDIDPKYVDLITSSDSELNNKYLNAVKERKEKYKGSKYAGNVDLYNRPILLQDDGTYETLKSETFAYSDFGINKKGAFNVTPILPDGTKIDNLGQYILDQLKDGKKLEDLDVFMGGDYSSIDEAVKAATQLHEEQDQIYGTEANYLRQIQEINGYEGVTIEPISDEDYEKVIAAKEAYDMLQDSEDTYTDALQKQKDTEKSKTQDLLKIKEIKLDLIELEKDDSLTAKEKNKLLTDELKTKKEILGYKLQLAETEEEKEVLKKQYENDEKDTKEEKYQNHREGINNRISYYGSRVKDIQNKISLAEARGGQGTEFQYETMNEYLDLEIAWNKKNLENAKKKRDDAEWGTAEWKKYNDEIQEAQDNITECELAQIENNKAILLLPVKQYEDMNKELQEELDLLSENQAKIESAIGYASTLIQDQVDNLNKSKENITDYWDDQIKAVEDEKEALTKSNDELQRSIDLQNAKYNLEKAMRNKTTRVYRKGQGFVYESDQTEVRSAQDELDKLEHENAIATLDETIDSLTKQKEDMVEIIDDQIRSWEDYADKINKVSDSYERLTGLQDLIQTFGTDAVAKLLNKDHNLVVDFETTLNTVKTQVSDVEQKISANERLIATIQKEAEEYVKNAVTIPEAKKTIADAITDNEDEIKAIEKRTETTQGLVDQWAQAEESITLSLGNIQLVNEGAKETEFTTLSERIKNLKGFKKEASDIYDSIAKIMANAQSALTSLENMNNKASNLASSISNKNSNAKSNSSSKTNTTSNSKTNSKSNSKSNSKTTTTGLKQYHTGGIVGTGNKDLLHNLIALTGDNLKPNEVIAKLLKDEVVLNQPRMSNLFNNLGNTYKAILPTKMSQGDMSITIGDVNVYNPNNSDVIVDEIVKELPLKVIQKLNSRN
jgi:chromosome segregation ATPase